MNKGSTKLKAIIFIILLISLCLIIISQFGSWGTIDVQTKIGGSLREVELEAEFNEYSVDYNVITLRDGKVINQSSDYKVFLTGMGDFQKNVGEILDSYKTKDHVLKASILDINIGDFVYTNVKITTKVDFLPWWPMDMPQKVHVIVSIDSFNNLTQKVIINKVWIDRLTDWDDEIDDYTKSEKIWETSPNDELTKSGQSKKYSTEITITKDYGKFGLVGYADITVIDTDGEPVTRILKPYTSKSHPATINLYSMTQGEFFSIITMIIAFPLSIICIILIGLALPFVFKSHRIGTWLILIAAIIGTLAIYFYINGLNILVDLLDSELETDIRGGFSFNMVFLSLPIISATLLYVGFIFSFLNHLPKAEKESRSWLKRKEGVEPKDEEKPEIVFKTLDENNLKESESTYEVNVAKTNGERNKSRMVKKTKKRSARKKV